MLVCMAVFGCAMAQDDDAGKVVIGKLETVLYYGTDVEPAGEVRELPELSEEQKSELAKLEKINFRHYRILGADTQNIYKSYINWAAPIRGSKEILLSFQPRGDVDGEKLQLDLEFWQARKKIIKHGPIMKVGVPLFIQGSRWKAGKVVIGVKWLKS